MKQSKLAAAHIFYIYSSKNVFNMRKMEGTQQTLFYKQFSTEVQVYVDSWTYSSLLSILQPSSPHAPRHKRVYARLNRLLILLPAHKKLDSRKGVRKT